MHLPPALRFVDDGHPEARDYDSNYTPARSVLQVDECRVEPALTRRTWSSSDWLPKWVTDLRQRLRWTFS